MGGQVVHARGGDRRAYRPVRSCLCEGSRPDDLCRGLLRLHPFTTIYIADLDSIGGEGDNDTVIRRLGADFPMMEFWIDSGLSAKSACLDWLAGHNGCLVLGSESQKDAATVREIVVQGGGRVVLSLDFRGDRLLGRRQLLDDPTLWPERVIVMTLERVGASKGPDYARLRDIMERAGGRDILREVIAAGGVGGLRDLLRLREIGARGVLLASALFDGRVGREELLRSEGGGPSGDPA